MGQRALTARAMVEWRAMRLELRNIGPINRAEIDLDELAILVGPNASGKTTLSTAAYAVLLSYRATEFATVRWLERMSIQSRRRADVTQEELGDQFAALFRDYLEAELVRCYGPDVSKLPRRGRTGHGSAPRIIASHKPPGEHAWQLVFRIREGALTLESRHQEYVPPRFDRLFSSGDPSIRFSRVRQTASIRRRRLAVPIYFPAARSGYVQMQSVLSSLLIGALGRGYFDQIAIGKISGIAADFLQFLAETEPSMDSSLPSSAGDRLETELLHGHLRMAAAGEASKVIEFAPQGLDEYWPMDAAATSIAELAPLILYLRHRASPRDFLFIDEPEAHLHPSNQLVLADVLLDLAELIRGMVVGTHSEFFVTGISNGLLRRRDGNERPSVSLYELAPAETTGGYIATRCVVHEDAGFVVDQFSDVAEQALDEAESLFERRQSLASE